ncbi:hypothetical protein AEQU2_02812 [Aequorivita lipolytica]|nr:hypothetical protein AEQU2_02812 [Aequorivita lipolytica]
MIKLIGKRNERNPHLEFGSYDLELGSKLCENW